MRVSNNGPREKADEDWSGGFDTRANRYRPEEAISNSAAGFSSYLANRVWIKGFPPGRSASGGIELSRFVNPILRDVFILLTWKEWDIQPLFLCFYFLSRSSIPLQVSLKVFRRKRISIFVLTKLYFRLENLLSDRRTGFNLFLNF